MRWKNCAKEFVKQTRRERSGTLLDATHPPKYIWLTLKVDLEHLGTAPAERHLVLERSNNPALFDELKLDGSLRADLEVFEAGEGVARIQGTLQGAQLLTCSRSLEPFVRPFEIDVLVDAQKDDGLREQVLEDEDDELFVFRIPASQESVDITECIRQLIMLQEPMNPVKDPSQDFTWKDPEAKAAQAQGTDPRWEKLKELKDKLDKR